MCHGILCCETTVSVPRKQDTGFSLYSVLVQLNLLSAGSSCCCFMCSQTNEGNHPESENHKFLSDHNRPPPVLFCFVCLLRRSAAIRLYSHETCHCLTDSSALSPFAEEWGREKTALQATNFSSLHFLFYLPFPQQDWVTSSPLFLLPTTTTRDQLRKTTHPR